MDSGSRHQLAGPTADPRGLRENTKDWSDVVLRGESHSQRSAKETSGSGGREERAGMDLGEISGFLHWFPFQHRREVDSTCKRDKPLTNFQQLLTDEADFFLICMCFVCWRVVNAQP